MLNGRSARSNRVSVRLRSGQQAAISTLRIRVTDDVTVESVPQDADLLIVDRNAFKFQNVVYVLICTQRLRIDGSEVSLSSAPIAIAFSRPAVAQLLEGEWNVVEMEGGGHKATPDEVRGMTWSINGTTITATDPDGSTGKMEFKLNPNASPKEFDVSALGGNTKGGTSLGIYELKNSRLRICFNDEGRSRPNDFTDAAKRGYSLMTLEKAQKASDADGETSAEQPPQLLTPAAAGSQLRVLKSGRPVADNVVIRGSQGYSGSPLPSISETPSHLGVISLDKLEKGKTHWLLVRPSAVLKLDLAPVDAYYERELPSRTNLVGKNLDVNISVNQIDGEEFLLVTVLNRTKEEVSFSEADFHLMTALKGPGADARVFSPIWKKIAEGKEPSKITMKPGEAHTFRLDWEDWVKNGFWFSRADETITEPTFPELKPGKTWVRLTLGSAIPVWVTHPDVIIGVGRTGDVNSTSSRESKSEVVADVPDSGLLPGHNNAEAQDAAKTEVKEIQEELQQLQSLEESAEQKKGKQREQILRQSLEKYSAFYQKHRTQMAGLYSRFNYARCLRKLGEDKQARGVYDELLSLPGESESIKKLRESVHSDIGSTFPTAPHFGGVS